MVKTSRADNLKQALEEVVDGLGGFNHFFQKGEVVLIKPNFNTSDPFPASTDIEFLKEVVDLIYQTGAEIIIGESSTFSRNTREEMEKLGVFKLEKAQVRVFEEHEWIVKNIPNAKYLKKVTVPKILDEVDKLVLLPCLKTHSYAQFTGALKLSVGFMSPKERMALHLRNLQEKIVDLNRIIHPDLIIMDARKCFINKGPSSGEVKEPGIIMASKSRVNIDIEGIKIIQNYQGNSLADKNPLEIPQIKLALGLGL